MEQSQGPLNANATNPHRWADNDEILYCLQSIANHAPWMRRIWIVTNGDVPDLSALARDVRSKIRFVRHDDIFDGFEGALPTFNSLAIESVLWRIEGLRDRFLYFNDDVFLTAPLRQSDVFEDGAPVLRGKWVDYSATAQDLVARDDPALFNYFMQINAAALMGFESSRLFATAHVVHPMRRSIMADAFADLPREFAANIMHRFRDITQFLPQGLHNHLCIAQGVAVLHSEKDYVHIKSGQGVTRGAAQTRAALHMATQPHIKFLCVNDLPQLEIVIPDARTTIAAAIGGFATALQDRKQRDA